MKRNDFFDDDLDLNDEEFNSWLNNDDESITDDNDDDSFIIDTDKYLNENESSNRIDKSIKPLPLKFCEFSPENEYSKEFIDGLKVVQVPYFKLLTINNQTSEWIKYFKTIKYLNKDVKPYIIIAVLKSYLIDVIPVELFDYLITFIYADSEKFNKRDLFTNVRTLLFNDNLLRKDYIGNKEEINKFKKDKISKLNRVQQINKGEKTTSTVIECYNTHSKDVGEISFKTGVSKPSIYKILRDNGLDTKPLKKSGVNGQIITFINDKLNWSTQPLTNKIICGEMGINCGVLSRFFKVYPEFKTKIKEFNEQL